jgi:hypothetical protein
MSKLNLKINRVVGVSILFHVIFVLLLTVLGLPVLNSIFYLIGALLGVTFMVADTTIFKTWYQLKQPISKTFLFLLIYIPVLVFILTSSGSYLASGILLSIGMCRFVSFANIIFRSNSPDVPKDVLVGGESNFSITELQAMTLILAGLLFVFFARIILYV